jgi:DNA ligase (NAD+)
MTTVEQIKELEDKIREAQTAYYDGHEIMTDDEYDALEDALRVLDPDNKIFTDVGADTSSGAFKKAKHIMPMGSQAKCRDEKEMRAWWDKNAKKGERYLVEFKYDGASLELIYKNGKLTQAITRGNGVMGDDITENAKKIPGIPAVLKDTTFNGGIRGEVLLTHENFEKYFKPQGMKNCRNAAAGTMKQKEGKGCEYLTFRAYNVWVA